jgi:hypothetical protein
MCEGLTAFLSACEITPVERFSPSPCCVCRLLKPKLVKRSRKLDKLKARLTFVAVFVHHFPVIEQYTEGLRHKGCLVFNIDLLIF